MARKEVDLAPRNLYAHQATRGHVDVVRIIQVIRPGSSIGEGSWTPRIIIIGPCKGLAEGHQDQQGN